MTEPDFVRLIDYCVKIAKKALSARATFDPFAAVLVRSGAVLPLNVPMTEEHPTLQTLLQEYKILLKTTATRGVVTALALCFDGRVSLEGLSISQVDEIRLRLESVEHDAIDVVVPYRKGGFWGNQYGKMTAVRRKGTFFPDIGAD